MTLSEDDGGGNPTAEPASQTRSDAPQQKIEVVVIRDIYWDTLIVPLPRQQAEPEPPGRLIELASKASHDKQIEVKGYRHSNNEDDLKADRWGRALSVIKLFPKGVGGDTKKQVYRIKECYGWVAPSSKPDQRYPPPMPQRYEEVFRKLNDTIKNEIANVDNTALGIVVINDDNHIFRHLEASRTVIIYRHL